MEELNMNIRNHGVVVGRLTKDPVVFTNGDGSRKIMVTVAAQDNYKNANNERGTQFIALEAFVSNKSNSLGAFDYMHKGDLVGFEYSVRSNNYTDKNGKAHYGQVLFIQSTDLMESRKSQAARATANATSAAADMPADMPDADEEPFA